MLATCYFEIGKHDLTIELCNKIVTENDHKEFPQAINMAHYWLGEFHYDLNDFQKATGSYSKAIDGFSKVVFRGKRTWVYAWATFSTGESYEIMGERNKAIEYYKKVEKDASELTKEPRKD